MTIWRTVATLAATSALAALPVSGAAQHHGGGGSHEVGDHGQVACEPSGSSGGGHVACGHDQGTRTHAAAPASASSQVGTLGAAQAVTIEVTSDGFIPAQATVKAGRPVTLVVTRKVERTCASEIVVKEYGISRPLPLGQAVEITFTPKKAGPIRYACAMDMIAGTLIVQ